jgi:hypothetical protein
MDHPHIVDSCERVLIPSIDYRPLLNVDDDVIHLDWDVAVGLIELRHFAKKCIANPEIVRVAPTMMYKSRFWYSEGYATRPWTTNWMVYVQDSVGKRVVYDGEPFANYFGFGMVYLPQWTIKEFAETLNSNEHFRDGNFCEWYFKRTNGQPVPVEWDTNAVHTNYDISNALEGLN